MRAIAGRAVALFVEKFIYSLQNGKRCLRLYHDEFA